MICPLPSGLMIQVMELTVKIWPGLGKAMELEKRTIWLAMKISTHTPYLTRHYRRNLVGSLPRGIPTVVDESVEVRVIQTGW